MNRISTRPTGVPSREPSRRRRKIMRLVGWVCTLLVLDQLAGSAYAWVEPLPDVPGRQIDLRPAGYGGSPGPRQRPDEALASSTAMRPYLWRQAYFAEYTHVQPHYEPYLTMQLWDLTGRYINVHQGVRRSWDARSTGSAHRPTVWFFGGSTMFGVGQRDDYTIPSMVARRSAAAGQPIRVVNLGVPAFTNFQEVLTFERRLALRPAPDAVVFYDGLNDLTVQMLEPSDQPAIYPADLNIPKPELSVDQRWTRRSLIHRLWGRYSPFASAPAGANPTGRSAAETARTTVDLYQRGLDLAGALARSHGTKLIAFWQPARYFDGLTAARLVRTQLPRGVIDLSGSLDGIDRTRVYLDLAHTNELGARLVADRMWPAIERQLP